MRGLLVVLGLTILVSACKKDIDRLPPTACFTFSAPQELVAGDPINFQNCSENATYFNWDFGDGSFSYEAAPIHKYDKPGCYRVRLTAYNKDGQDTISETINLEVCNLHDTLITAAWQSSVSFDIDMDKDDQYDVTISCYSQGGSSGQRDNVSLTLTNGFEIVAFDDSCINWCPVYPSDTMFFTTHFTVPRKFGKGDTINLENSFTNKLVYLAYRYGNSQTPCTPVLYNQLVGYFYFYLAIRRIENSRTYLGWIKVKVTDLRSIRIDSYKAVTEANALVI